MADYPINIAAQTISGVLTDLDEVHRHLATAMDELETERTARILDRLSEEIAEAASLLRSAR